MIELVHFSVTRTPEQVTSLPGPHLAPTHWLVREAWLPVVGPTAMLAAMFVHDHAPDDWSGPDLARALGLGQSVSKLRYSFERLNRLTSWACWVPDTSTLEVWDRVPLALMRPHHAGQLPAASLARIRYNIESCFPTT